ncbi:hypothetical protein CQA53_04400 [Helicobacter didelphidarum]|uniref:Transmembrane protein n=1 Tax=Helicobacter didelphidarum TaxID=2040648 RepID=A0A3D8IMT7_9HELI|nr:hypothetical protein [Helicobacter didelphidarum]RDU66255.1 hypothetical protein CQA53_04400 [Helicobacter didelphidarum]
MQINIHKRQNVIIYYNFITQIIKNNIFLYKIQLFRHKNFVFQHKNNQILLHNFIIKTLVVLCIFLFTNVEYVFGDSINRQIDFLQWQKRIKFSPPKKACATCDWTISYSIENPILDNATQSMLFQDSEQNSTNVNKMPTPNELKNLESSLQNSALQNLFDEDYGNQENDSLQYEFLGQRGQNEFLDMQTRRQDDIFANPLHQNTPYSNTLDAIKLSKAIFMKRNISQAYEEILKHRGIFTCMYCGELDKIFKQLPKFKTKSQNHNISYVYEPLGNLYMIEISDNICGVIDTMMFVQDKDSVELWVYSRFSCKSS